MAVKVKRFGWQARENSVTRSRREGNPRWKTKGSRGEPPCGHARHSPLFLRDASTSLLPPRSFLFSFFFRSAIDHLTSYRDRCFTVSIVTSPGREGPSRLRLNFMVRSIIAISLCTKTCLMGLIEKYGNGRTRKG